LLEIPQAEADILTAGLRSNPLLFYSSDSIPYGSYSPRRPGEIDQGISVAYPVDFSGKRRARVALARHEKAVLQAQYQNAVRLAIDDLYTAYVDALAARQAVRAAERSIGLIDALLRTSRARTPRTAREDEDDDDLLIERELTTMSVGDERSRDQKARQRLGQLLDLTPEQADALEVRGSIRVLDPTLPPAETLVAVARRHRPDLAAITWASSAPAPSWSRSTPSASPTRTCSTRRSNIATTSRSACRARRGRMRSDIDP
jgi:cobalt-zinc-cadmium efflux system outer membrane protein